MNLRTTLDRATEDLLRVSTVFADRMFAMRDAMSGQPGAQSFEVVRSGGHVVSHCWKHGCDLSECSRADRLCSGETIPVNDPAGEAAVLRALGRDRAASDHRSVQQLVGRIDRDIQALVFVLEHYSSNRAVDDRIGIGECTDCKRYSDGKDKNRLLSRYKGGDPVCRSCRNRRDGRPAA